MAQNNAQMAKPCFEEVICICNMCHIWTSHFQVKICYSFLDTNFKWMLTLSFQETALHLGISILIIGCEVKKMSGCTPRTLRTPSNFMRKMINTLLTDSYYKGQYRRNCSCRDSFCSHQILVHKNFLPNRIGAHTGSSKEIWELYNF